MTHPPRRRWRRIVAAVRACVGTRFRSQGRIPGLALDCVGVVLVAAQAAGVAANVPAYALGGVLPDVELLLRGHGCRRVAQPQPGDIIVIAPVGGQRHFGVLTPAGVVHAHAGLGRVVEGPLDADWPVVSAWRLRGAR